MNKENLSDRLNELLGINEFVDFSKMTREDLDILLKIVSDPSNLIRTGWRNLRNDAKQKLLEEIVDRPLLDEILNRSVERNENRGPLGLGILPSIFRRKERS